MKKYFSLIMFFLSLFLISDAYAASSSGDIFDKLAIKAGVVGNGLRESGFIIAGLGMIMFTFMAIFNKLQWKHLAYIMFSTAVLSGMIALITEFRTDADRKLHGKVNADSFKSFSYQGYKASDAEGGSNVKSISITK